MVLNFMSLLLAEEKVANQLINTANLRIYVQFEI